MNRNVVYVGIDVDDVTTTGGQLEKSQGYFADAQLKLCYEASYIGFSLQRDLQG